MIIENEYGRVEFNIDFNQYKKIGMSFSGGCDSSLLLYFLLKLFDEQNPEAKIIPITGITINKGKWKLFRSQEILDHLIEKFPNVKNKVAERQINYNYTQEEYGRYTESLFDKKIIDLRIFGLTKNPPFEIMEKHDLLRKRVILRDEIDLKLFKNHPNKKGGPTYDVFRNIDKRWIAKCYYDFGLMEYVYPLTVSCERVRETPDMLNNEEPCRHCWWCREKKMAFGTYDGGVS